MATGSQVTEMLMVMSREELKAHLAKLDALQRRLTDVAHIEKIDSLIPQAERFAKKKAGGNTTLQSTLFVREMNRLTREAGLRSC